MKILGAFMLPHPPLIVDEIGKEKIEDVKKTRYNYLKIAKEISNLKPDTIIISSPHAPLYRDYFYLPNEENAIGSFSKFGAKEVTFNKKYDIELIKEIENISIEKQFPCGRVDSKELLDHGTMVPLYFVNKFYTDYKLVVIGLSGISLESNYEMGKIIKEACEKLDRNVVYIASGDLSHKLQEYGPYGFDENGPKYDEKIIDVMSNARFEELLNFDLDFLDKAAECGHRSFIMMSGFLDDVKVKPTFYSHEDITGVGYGICSYYPIDFYIELARKTINTYIKENKIIDIPEDTPKELLDNKAGVFVSIHKNDELRGCIGTIFPTTNCIAKEIINNAISASTKDPRFNPVTVDELNSLEINVDVLTTPEEITDKSLLDPKKYGVIVTSGLKRGVLLPDLDGVDTVDEQISISKRKAGISDNEKIKLERFEVVRHK